MEEKHWQELDLIGQRMVVAKRLLARAEEYGAQHDARHFRAEIAALNRQRENIIVSIAEVSVAA